MTLYFYGVIDYDDIFGDSHTTRFRLFLGKGDANYTDIVALSVCPIGNEAT